MSGLPLVVTWLRRLVRVGAGRGRPGVTLGRTGAVGRWPSAARRPPRAGHEVADPAGAGTHPLARPVAQPAQQRHQWILGPGEALPVRVGGGPDIVAYRAAGVVAARVVA